MNIADALALFLEAAAAEGLAPKTLTFYSYHINCFIASLAEEKRDITKLVASDFNRFLAGERARGQSETSVYGCYRSLDRFFNWCEVSEEVGCVPSPMKNQRGRRVVKVKKPAKKAPQRAGLATVDGLIEALPRGTWIQIRNRVALRLLRDTGVRIGEAADVRIADLDLEERVLTIPKSKSRKSRQVCLTPALIDEIRAYLLCRPPCPPQVAGYLFVAAVNDNPDNGVRGRLSSEGLRLMITKLCERAGLPHTNPHSIRHMFGTKALNDGIRLEVVSELMGHHDPGFTRRVYADLLNDTVKREFDQHWR
jgi:integrase/recombinase XerD